MPLQTERQDAKDLVKSLFKNDRGQPFEMTDGQADIFNSIFLRKHLRNQIMTPTRYGKSETIALALIIRSITFKEKWTILAPSGAKANIIMSKLIQHIYDHEYIEQQIDHSNIPQIERLKHKRNVEHITWLRGGAVLTLSADARNAQRTMDALTGFGSDNLVEDEATLVPDDLQAMAMRMLGDQPDSFLLKIGNPFYRNHFLRTWQKDSYHKIKIDYHQALEEGRFTESFIDEMREEPFFKELYEVEFPDQDSITIDGYQRLIPDELLESAWLRDYNGEIAKELPKDTKATHLGGDMAGGGSDRTVYVLRNDNLMWFHSGNKDKDTMTQPARIMDIQDEWELEAECISIDITGLGKGVGDRLHELNIETNNVNFAHGAPDEHKSQYINVRAWMYFELLSWLKKGGKILFNEVFYELVHVYYKIDSGRRSQIMKKETIVERMKKAGMTITSPDVADAAILTFGQPELLSDDEDWEFV